MSRNFKRFDPSDLPEHFSAEEKLIAGIVAPIMADCVNGLIQGFAFLLAMPAPLHKQIFSVLANKLAQDREIPFEKLPSILVDFAAEIETAVANKPPRTGRSEEARAHLKRILDSLTFPDGSNNQAEDGLGSNSKLEDGIEAINDLMNSTPPPILINNYVQ